MNKFDNRIAVTQNCSEKNAGNFVDNTKSLPYTNEQIDFVNYSYDYCVCFVDIVNSTNNTDKIEPRRIRDYYSLFLNTMSSIIKNYDGKVIKNSGDSLLYYFPNTANIEDELAFQLVIECGLEMMTMHKKLNLALKSYDLPSINYRISANYGRVEIAISSTSHTVDIFGSTVNVCSKINHLAPANQMVIYSNLYEIIKRKSFCRDYSFKHLVPNVKININYSDLYTVNRIDDIFKQKEIENKLEKKIIERRLNKQNLANSCFNVIIVDDDKDILFTFDSIIRDKGYNVICFSNPLYVVDHLLQTHPHFYHLIIMDIRMPDLNGIKLYSKIKAINPRIKVLFISALNAIEELLSIFPEIKFGEILHKPIEPEILLSKIDRVLRS